jgi:hypothetical protein
MRSEHRRRAVSPLALEPLEVRRALAVAAPTIRLMAASDTGVKGDGITRVALPAFAGFAPRGAFVAVYAQGDNLLGVARANIKGVWSLTTPAARRFAAGEQIVTATSVDTVQNAQSDPTPLWIKVDTTAPTASLAYDQVNGVATLSFSKPVAGVKLASLRLVGMTTEGVAVNVPLNDPGLAPYVGSVSLQRSPDGRIYTFRERFVLAEPGTFRLSLVAQGSGITDMAGNPLARGVTTSFRII